MSCFYSVLQTTQDKEGKLKLQYCSRMKY